jgi:hypothetical protein
MQIPAHTPAILNLKLQKYWRVFLSQNYNILKKIIY